jgi:putative Mg2+ transporter-C (MgtC) family protein
MAMIAEQTESMLDLAIALAFGAVIGAEREWRRHPGSLRSCAIVAAAACAIARLAVLHTGGNPGPALGAIATGVGFLGSGVIMRQGELVRGLSTAATFWAVAAVGMSAGVTEYGISALLTAAVCFAHGLLRPLSIWIDRRSPKEHDPMV